MGINGFQQYLKKKYPQSFSYKWSITYDNLYIDLNYVLHNVSYLLDDVDEIIKKTLDYIKNVIISIKPQKRIIIMADGLAPLAKMILQRKRRINSMNRHNIDLNFTVGTKFMLVLEKCIIDFCEQVKQKYDLTYIIDIKGIGEGEVKIKYNLNILHNENINDTHIVYSSDSDVILLLITCVNPNKIYQKINKMEILHYGTLYDKHIEDNGNTVSSKYDFVFFNLLMGNDYLPKIYYLTFDKIWSSYKKVSYLYPNGIISNFDKNNLTIDIDFITAVIHNIMKVMRKNMYSLFDYKQFCDKSYPKYVEGLLWCMTMYSLGYCHDNTYIYEKNTYLHIMGLMYAITFRNSYNIVKSIDLNPDCCSILLLPIQFKHLLKKEQILIADKLNDLYPIIYEESNCLKCKTLMENVNIEDIDINVLKYETNEHKKTHKKLKYLLIQEISNKYVELLKDVVFEEDIIVVPKYSLNKVQRKLF